MAWSSSNRSASLPEGWQVIANGVLEDAGHLCQIQGPGCIRHATEVDHIRRGNDHSRENLRGACSRCHGKKSSAEGHAAKAAMKAKRFRPVEKHPGSI